MVILSPFGDSFSETFYKDFFGATVVLEVRTGGVFLPTHPFSFSVKSKGNSAEKKFLILDT